MSWKETLERWLGRRRRREAATPDLPATDGRAGRLAQPLRLPPDLPLPAGAMLTLLSPLGRFLEERRRRLAGWGWNAVRPLPAWASRGPLFPAAGRARTGWRGYRKAPWSPSMPRTEIAASRIRAFARERIRSYQYHVAIEEPQGPAPPEYGATAFPWLGTLQGAPPSGQPFPALDALVARGEPSEERILPQDEAPSGEGGSLPRRPGDTASATPTRSSEWRGRPFPPPAGTAAVPRDVPAAPPQGTSAETPRPRPGLPERSVAARVRRALEWLRKELRIGERPPRPARRAVAGQPQEVGTRSAPIVCRPVEFPPPAGEGLSPQGSPFSGKEATSEQVLEPGAKPGDRFGFPAFTGFAGYGPGSVQALSLKKEEAEPRTPSEELGSEAREPIQVTQRAQAVPAVEGPRPFGRRLLAKAGRGDPLPPPTRSFLEAVLRRPLGGLRIRSGGEVSRAVRDMGVAAATLGSEIWLSSSFPGLETPGGLALLAHEAVHAIQAAARGPAREGAPEAREEEAQALRIQAGVEALLETGRLRVSAPSPAAPLFPELPVSGAQERRAAAPLPISATPSSGPFRWRAGEETVAPAQPFPVVAAPSFGPFRRAPAEETVPPAQPPSPPAPLPGPDIEALAEEVYRRLRYRLELEREQRGIERGIG
ncbi:MAG: eCIS core domain-containing protein [Chloroflexia bacterium]